MDVVFASDTRPLESVTVAVNVIVPEVFKNPVVAYLLFLNIHHH